MSWIIEENTDPTFQDWGEAYKELCELVRTKVPEIKHIDLYYGQDQVVDSTGNWIPFKAPALFMQFDVVQAQDLGDQTQQLLVDVTMYLAMETVQDTNDRSLGQRRALEFVAMMRRLHMELHGKAGDHFNALSRVGMSKKADAPPYMYMYGQTYRTVLLDNSTSKQWSWREPGTLGLEIEPHTAPPVPVGRLVVVRNSDDTYSVEVEAPDVHTLPDVTHTDSNGLPVTQPALTPFVATQCPSPLPATARLRQTGGAQIGGDHIIPSGGSLDIVAPNGIVSVRNSLNVELSQVFPMSGQSINAPVPDSTFRIKDSANNDIGSAYEITAGGTGQGIVPDSIITKPDGTTANLRATQPLDVRNYRSGILYAFSEARWSGQVTSYRFGDEGTAYATLFFQMPVPLYPSQVAKLGNTWTTLGSLNKWGDNRRFTDRTGGTTYADRIVHDHLTNLYWYSPVTLPTGNWFNGIDGAVASTAGGLTGWLLPPMRALQSIINNEGGTLLNYAPFNITGVTVLTSTSNPTSATFNALPMLNTGAFQSVSKNTSASYLICRQAEP